LFLLTLKDISGRARQASGSVALRRHGENFLRKSLFLNDGTTLRGILHPQGVQSTTNKCEKPKN
jgi:hypothetical protein